MSKFKTYIVHSLYTLYLALLDSSYKNEKSNIIILDHTEEIDYFKLKDKVKKIYWINEVIIVKDIKEKYYKCIFYSKKNVLLKTLEKYYEENYQKLLSEIKNIENDTREIYVSYDDSVFFRKIFYRKIKYILLEDGYMTYEKRSESKIKTFLRLFFLGLYPYRENKNIQYIKVLHKEKMSGILNSNIKIIDFNYKLKIEKLNSNIKRDIIEIFLSDKLKINKNSSLIITQCFYQDGILKSYEREKEMYLELLKDVEAEEILYIKRHPRDKIKKFKSNCKNEIILPEKFPLEVLDLLEDKKKFKKIYAITSTAADNLLCCKQKIKRIDLLEKYKKLD